MSNLPENQEINNNQENTAEESSTVFSAPSQHDGKDKKTKKPLKTIICAFLVVAILLGSTIAVVNLIPEREEETKNPAISDIEILAEDDEDFKRIVVNNKNGKYIFNSNNKKWSVENYSDDVINSSEIDVIVSATASINGFRKITQMTIEECGLTNPEIKIDILKTDSDEFSILIGANSADNSGCYVKLSNSDEIYIADNSVKESFEFSELDLAVTDDLPAFDIEEGMDDYVNSDGVLSNFDKLVIKSVNFSDELVVHKNDDEVLSDYAPYIITSPTNRIAENMTDVFSLFSTGKTVDGVYSLDVKSATLKKFGLDNPDFQAKIYIKNKTLTYKFALQEDGNYAVVCDESKLISKVNAENAVFTKYKIHEFYSSWICLISIDHLDSFTFKDGNTTYNFKIDSVNDENAEDKYNITLNGEKIDTESFQKFYEECISLTCTDFTISDVSSKPDYSITFKYDKEHGGDQTVIDFYKSGATRYQYKTDGVTLGKVTASSIASVKSALEKISLKSN